MDNTGPRDLRPHLRRLRNPDTGAWLHLSGQGETRDIALAWCGTRDQARTLRERAQARGDDFPFQIAPLTRQTETQKGQANE
jgi:hypothetical protein